MRALTILLLFTASASAEIVCVRYGPCPLDLSSFTCADTSRSSFVKRFCYHAQKKFVAIKLNETWYPYCEVPPPLTNLWSMRRLLAPTTTRNSAASAIGRMVLSTVVITQCRSFRRLAVLPQ